MEFVRLAGWGMTKSPRLVVMAELQAGSPVRVTGGTYKGRVGTVTKLTNKQVYVSSPECDPPEVRISQTSVTVTELENLMGGLNVGPRTPTSRTPQRPPRAPEQIAPPSFQLPGSDAATATVGGTPIDRIVMRRCNAKPDASFLSEWAGGRALVLEYPLPLGEGTTLAPKIDNFQGNRYELLAAKVVDAGKGLHGAKVQSYRLTYAAVEGDGVLAINLREELERHGDFASCSTVRKAVARLLMYVSSAKRAVRLRSSDFEVVPEPTVDGIEMADGCAFIPDDMLWDEGGGVGALAALRAIIDREGLDVKKNVNSERTTRVIAAEIDTARALSGGTRPSALSEALQLLGVQLRVMGPQLGVIKGVLMRKPNISKIQITQSMIKVPPRRAASTAEDDWVSFIVKQAQPLALNLTLTLRPQPRH